ncbi:MAG: DUF5518 domain-containing protein [Candidatus Methanoperedens sp.]
MTKYIFPSIIGFSISIVLGFIITPLLSVIVGGFIAGILCKGGSSGGAGVGLLIGVIYAIPIYLFAGMVASIIPFLGVILGGLGIGIMFFIGILGLIGGTLGGFVGNKRES